MLPPQSAGCAKDGVVVKEITVTADAVTIPRAKRAAKKYLPIIVLPIAHISDHS